MVIYGISNQNNELYIGTSTSNQSAANISNHLHGKVKCTREYFSADITNQIGIHLLERSGSDRLAQDYIAAYSQYFQSQGYHVLNSVPKNCNEDEVAAIFSCLGNEPAQALLNRTRVKNAATLNPGVHNQSRLEEPAEELVALTIRMSKTERKRIVDWAKTRNVSQREALMMLMTCSENQDEFIDWTACQYLGNILSELHQQVDSLKEENKSLRHELWKTNMHSDAKTDRLMDRARKTQAGVMTFFDLFESNCPTPFTLEEIPYAEYKCIFTGKNRYRFPAEPGYCIFIVHAIVRPKHPGKAPFYFVIGSDPCGNKLMLRVYDKYYYTGIGFKNNSFSYRYSAWVVGYERAKDTVMDAIFAFPLELQPRYDMPWYEASQWRRALEDMLRSDAAPHT